MWLADYDFSAYVHDRRDIEVSHHLRIHFSFRWIMSALLHINILSSPSPFLFNGIRIHFNILFWTPGSMGKGRRALSLLSDIEWGLSWLSPSFWWISRRRSDRLDHCFRSVRILVSGTSLGLTPCLLGFLYYSAALGESGLLIMKNGAVTWNYKLFYFIWCFSR